MAGGYTGKDLVAWGLAPGPHFPAALAAANAAATAQEARAAALAFQPAPRIAMTGTAAPRFFIEAEDAEGWANLAAVERDMRHLMKCPTIAAGAVMPDACPAGTIPVGGIVATEDAIHPGFHSADICCSVMMTVHGDDVDPKRLLDAAHATTHFGGGGRAFDDRVPMPEATRRAFEANPLLRDLAEDAAAHFATQGDGNHFLLVGRLASTGAVAIVTHHGSRCPGAQLYRKGMALARRHTKAVADVPDKMAWIPAASRDGEDYWHALGEIAAWTFRSHLAIHERAQRAAGARAPRDMLWNAHNFVFREEGTDGAIRFVHAKGATPMRDFLAEDDPAGRRLVPMNMAEGVLVVNGPGNPEAFGFAPHGAGRVRSRSQHIRDFGGTHGGAELEELRAAGLDVRFWHGRADATELPSAYKSAEAVRAQMEGYGLAKVIDRVIPTGCIMAGEWSRPAPPPEP